MSNMIYLANTTQEQQVLIPSSGLHTSGAAMLELREGISRQIAYYETFTSLETAMGGNYYVLDIDLPNGLKNGEYAYVLTQDGETIAEGVCQIGDYVQAVTPSAGSAQGIIIKQS